uniref:ATP synthase F0 subunit 8 n=1 Tax=Viana regina TaxID=1882667 RepID=A0A1B2G3G7_9GAST|nr:ATP synthase F0 subunit 8 [Viana regina]
MAQLSSLNWIFLYFMFWWFLLILVCINWWMIDLKYVFPVVFFDKLGVNKWSW